MESISAGLLGKLAWALVHLAFLVGWRSRAAVLADWAWTLSTGRRVQQIILEPVADDGLGNRHSL